MKKTFIKRLATLMLFAITGSNLFSQGFYVYTKDGLRQDYQSENVDSIVFYEKVVGDIEPGGSDNFIDGHEYVDLGLPSGLKWATCNVGASKPEEYGGYYAWGETTTKNSYRLATYKWCEGTKSTMTKYCTQSNYGTVDSLTTLTSSDDVATIKWGSKWRIPTEEEMEELVKNCTWTWATQGGKKGMTVTGPNGNSIFLPATGLRDDTDVFYREKYGYYWSATLGEFTSATACNLYFGSKNGSCQFCDRAGGLTVRPVTNGVENPDDENEEDEPIQEPDEEEVVIPEKPADTMEAVDLGLPSGLKWATCNVGATKPEEYGGYYAWGETEEKSDYDWDTYKWGISSSLTKYCTSSNYGTVDNKTVLDSEDDVAHVKLSDKWRMPTLDEIKELVNNCTWKWTTYNGVNGQLVTGPNGNSIFLPATGYRGGTDLYFRGSFGYYWSATLYEDNSIGAYGLSFSDSFHFWDRWGNRSYGFTVRPVTDGVENPDDENEEDKPIQKPDEEEVVTPEKPADTMEAVDLGLPCGLKWATCNVGASKPEEYGGYYAWGETEEKNEYSSETYKYYTSNTGYVNIASNISGTQYDVAHVKWGASWRIPTREEIAELVYYCTWQWTTYNGVNGYLVTGSNNNSIFLPAAGYREGTDFGARGSAGGYWSATLYESNSITAYNLYSPGGNIWDDIWNAWDDYSYRYYGFTVRPVTDGLLNDSEK